MKTIIVTVDPDGGIKIDAVGFKGADCEKATEFLEKALGSKSNSQRKPEFHHSNQQKQGAR